MEAEIIHAPDFSIFSRLRSFKLTTSIFLAGSIEMGAAVDWQTNAGAILSHAGFVVLNPRRDDWDSSWVQSIDNEEFAKQVRWELEGLERCHAVLVHIDPATKSPITLLELGLLSQLKPVATFISCPTGFWRRGNVEILADRYGMELYDSFEEAVGNVVRFCHEQGAGEAGE